MTSKHLAEGRDPTGMKLGLVNEEVGGSCISYDQSCLIGGNEVRIPDTELFIKASLVSLVPRKLD